MGGRIPCKSITHILLFHPARRCIYHKLLPEGINASPTYCQCSRGFAEKYWEAALGRPVKVEVACTAITGGDECKFIICRKQGVPCSLACRTACSMIGPEAGV
jgi:hypothetical protein